MEIVINDEPVGYTLEGEEQASEVLGALTHWIDSKGFAIHSTSLNRGAIDMNSPSWKKLPLEALVHIDIVAVPLREKHVHDLTTAITYFHLLIHSLREKDDKLLRDLVQEFPYVATYWDSLDVSSQEETLFRTIRPLFEDSTLPSNEAFQKVKPLFLSLKEILSARKERTEDPRGRAKNLVSSLLALSPELLEVPALFQVGKDNEAMRLIKTVVDILVDLLQTLPLCAKESPARFPSQLEEYIVDLNQRLKELLSSLQSQDYVLAGDLVEYELLPRFERLPTLLA